ncbi:MAG: orotidine-5'-phosphate decarboxylase [Candidatus Omnitrophota bacterium]
MNPKPQIILALDVPTLKDAKRIVDILYPMVELFKIGSQLFTASGQEAIKMVGEKGAKVFLDLKFHDIPNTVYGAVASGTSSSIAVTPISTGSDNIRAEDQVQAPVFMMTLHTIGGLEMLKAAVRGASDKAANLKIKKPYLVGVTVLTSEIPNSITSETVLKRASLAKDAGLDGVVCAVSEAEMIRKKFGEEFLIVTPGIRLKGDRKGDQKRVSTVQEAIKAGSDYLVIGRPILQAKDPLIAAQEILKSV